uniref:Uncharacterized protein n=1 Tax=Schistocephalus solidus TaxID=70667 RepID=A0A0X3NVS1_SCHSO
MRIFWKNDRAGIFPADCNYLPKKLCLQIYPLENGTFRGQGKIRKFICSIRNEWRLLLNKAKTFFISGNHARHVVKERNSKLQTNELFDCIEDLMTANPRALSPTVSPSGSQRPHRVITLFPYRQFKQTSRRNKESNDGLCRYNSGVSQKAY